MYNATRKKRSANDLEIKISLLRNSPNEIHIAKADKTKETQVLTFIHPPSRTSQTINIFYHTNSNFL